MSRHKIRDKRKEENKVKFSDIEVGNYYEDVDTIKYLKTSALSVFDIDNNDERVIDESDKDKMVTPLETSLIINSSR